MTQYLKATRKFAMSAVAVMMIGIFSLQGLSATPRERTAVDLLMQTIYYLRQEVPTLTDRREYQTGTLNQGYYQDHKDYFNAGVEYAILAVGCEHAQDIDMGVFDAKGTVLARDTNSSSVAIIKFVPRYTGYYTVRVTMYRTISTADAEYAYQVFYRN
ncbi:MAG TPA: hypothetical protein PL157_23925 [Acidobacteriota bacterium]|nr:hypothetical protein [Acidobacteriota bacterium]